MIGVADPVTMGGVSNGERKTPSSTLFELRSKAGHFSRKREKED